MPLLDNPFNRCKSDLKFIEAASHRVTAIASPTAYADTIVDGQTGIIFQRVLTEGSSKLFCVAGKGCGVLQVVQQAQ